MPDRARPDRIGFEIRTEPAGTSWRVPVSGRPFRILILGDFSGRDRRNGGDRTGPGLAGRKPIRVDRDTLDQVLGRVAPTLQFGAAEAGAGAEKQSLTLRWPPDVSGSLAITSRRACLTVLMSRRFAGRPRGWIGSKCRTGSGTEYWTFHPAVPISRAAAPRPAQPPAAVLSPSPNHPR
jgi:hypothetical protein